MAFEPNVVVEKRGCGYSLLSGRGQEPVARLHSIDNPGEVQVL
jgi:hypothetical protein